MKTTHADGSNGPDLARAGRGLAAVHTVLFDIDDTLTGDPAAHAAEPDPGGSPPRFGVFPEVPAVIRTLHAAGFSLYTATTNASSVACAKLAEAGLADANGSPYFRGTLGGSEISPEGKSSPRFFRDLLALYGLDPATVVHVGDHPVSDVQFAREAGIERVIRVDRSQTREVLEIEPGVLSVRGLAPLLHLLDLPAPAWPDGFWRLVGQWEPHMFLARRGDGASADLDALWASIHDDAYLDRLVNRGVNLVHLPFHKGYGLTAERESIAETRAFAGRLRARGIRVGVYIGSTFFYEVFRHSRYEDMIRQTGGERGWSDDQYFRDPWCPNSPHARAYFQDVIRMAVEDIRADVLHFDHSWSGVLGGLCHCRYCLEGFRQYVGETIPEIVTAAGYSDPAHLLPPPPGRAAGYARVRQLKEPGAVAWLHYQARAGVEAMRFFADFARSLDPAVQILFNGATLCGITPFSRGEQSFDKLRIGDASFVEDSLENPVGLSAGGMPVARFRAYKAGWRTGCRILYYTSEKGRDGALMMAEAAVFSRDSLGCLGMTEQANRPLPGGGEAAVLRELVENDRLFRGREPWPQVGVLRHHESELLNPFPSALSPYVVEQMLFEGHIPFTLVDGTELCRGGLAGLDLLVAADARCLDGDELQGLEAFVEGGGRLLSIGGTATATRLNRFRPAWGLAPLFPGAPGPAPAGAAYRETAQSAEAGAAANEAGGDILRGGIGRGRAIHIPALDFRLPNREGLTRFSGYDWYYHPYWEAPGNAEVFRLAIQELLGDGLRLQTDLPRTVGSELYRTPQGPWLGLVNYAHPRPVHAAGVTLRLPQGAPPPHRAQWHAPEGGRELALDAAPDGRVRIRTPGFALYGVLRLQVQ